VIAEDVRWFKEAVLMSTTDNIATEEKENGKTKAERRGTNPTKGGRKKGHRGQTLLPVGSWGGKWRWGQGSVITKVAP